MMKTNKAHSSDAKIVLEYSKTNSQIAFVCHLRESLWCKNITSLSTGLLNDYTESVPLEVLLEKFRGDGEGHIDLGQEKLLSANLKTCPYP